MALEKIAALEEKLRAQWREMDNLRSSLFHSAYDERTYWTGQGHPPGGFCVRCDEPFHPRQSLVEYVDEAGQVMARYHEHCAGTR